jgi:hypothetical protein
MRMLLVAVVLLIVAAPANAHSPCNPPGSETIRETSKVRVYSVPRRAARDVFACLRPTGRRYRLGVRSGDWGYVTGVWPVRIRGELVAWTSYAYDRYGNWSSHVYVADVRRRRVLAHRGAGPGSSCEGARLEVSALALAPSGSVAWIDQRHGCEDGREVAALEDGVVRTLDRGAGIEPSFLRWSDGHVLWRGGGEYRSAPLR